MFRILLIVIVSGFVYYLNKSVGLAAGVFVVLTGFMLWLSQFDIVRRREEINQAKGNLEDAFQKRYDILTKIYETTKGYIKFKEQELDTITNLICSIEKPTFGYKEKFRLQNQVQKILINSMESLRDNQLGFQIEALNRSINEVEENLSASRRFYNHAVKEYNTAISVFPTIIPAKVKRYQAMSYFEVEDESIRKDIEMNFD